MKRIFIAIFMVTAVMASVSCQKENELKGEVLSSTVFTAIADGQPGTKATLQKDEDAYKFIWQDGDKIRLYTDDASHAAYLTSGANSNAGEFTAEATLEVGSTVGLASFPYDHTGNSEIIYPAAVAGYKNGAMYTPMLAVPATPLVVAEGAKYEALYFNHVGGALKFILKDMAADVTSVVFTAEDDIAGKYTVAAALTADAVKDGSWNTAAAELSKSVTFSVVPSSEMTFYLPVVAGVELSGKLTIEVYAGAKLVKSFEKTFKDGKSYTVKRAVVANLGEFRLPALKLAKDALIGVDEARDYELNVSCNAEWTATADKEWIKFKTGSGTGDGKLVVSLDAIGTEAARTGNITVKSGDLECNVFVEQGNGVLIGGDIWAKYDVAAPGTFTNAIETRGNMYQWNSKIAYAAGNVADTTVPEGYATGIATYPEDVTTWQEENNPCPKGWTVPTINQVRALTGYGQEGEARYKWGWGAIEQGAYIGNTDAATAHTVNGMHGNIFIPMSAKRNSDGTVTYTSSTFIQTAEKFQTWDGGYGRIYYQVHWDDVVYEFSGEGYAAMPVRCVAK